MVRDVSWYRVWQMIACHIYLWQAYSLHDFSNAWEKVAEGQMRAVLLRESGGKIPHGRSSEPSFISPAFLRLQLMTFQSHASLH